MLLRINACTGTTIEFALANFEKLVDKDDDIVICTIGTNHRHQNKTDAPKRTKCEHTENFYNNIVRLHRRFIEAGKDVIFVANIPASVEKEKDAETLRGIFHMNDVNDLCMKAAAECGFPFISLYMPFMEYCEQKGISVDALLSDGLHPNDKGHMVIFALMLKEFGIGRKALGTEEI